jgi:hypothetical protein
MSVETVSPFFGWYEKLTGIKIYPVTIRTYVYIMNIVHMGFEILDVAIYIYMDSKYGMDDHPYCTMYNFFDHDTFGSVWMPPRQMHFTQRP